MSFSKWNAVKLGDISDIRRGSSPRPIIDFISKSGMPWVKIADATESKTRFIERTKEFIKISGVEKSVVVNPGTLILSNSGTAGLPKIMDIQACIHDGWQVFDNLRGIDVYFLYYELLFIREKLLHGAYDSTMKNLTLDMVKGTSIDLPSINEQEAIAATLSCLDDKIELNNRINKTLEEMAQAIFKSWFIDFEPFQDGEFEDSELGRIPKGWRVGVLDECIDFYNGYAFKSNELLDNASSEECYHVFKMGHIKKGGGLNADGTKSWIEKNKCENILKYVLKVGDLLMCMTDMKGNVALLGHTALMNENEKFIVNQRVGLLRVNNDIGINYPYLFILTNSNSFIENLRGRANSGVQVNLSTNEIKNSKIIIAPKEINCKFNAAILPMFSQSFEISKQNQVLKATRDALLPKLMNGEIRVGEFDRQ